MGFVSFVSGAVLALTLAEGAFILAGNPGGRGNRLFFCMTLCLALWLLGAGLGGAGADGDGARLWFRVAAGGFLFLPCAALLFALEYSALSTGKAARAASASLCLPPAALLVAAWPGRTDTGSAAFALLVTYCLIYYGAAVALLARAARTGRRGRDRKQAAILAQSVAVTVALFCVEPFFLPRPEPFRGLGVSPLLGVVLLSGVAYAIRRYDFLSLGRLSRKREVLDHLSDAVILFDGRMRPVFRNAAARWAFPETESIGSLINEAAAVREEFLDVESSGKEDFSCVVSSRRDPALRFDCRFSLLRDAGGETEAVLMAGKEVKDRRSFGGSFALSRAENRVLSMTMEGARQAEIAERLGVSLRTVKAHCAHIYLKLGVHNRIELFRRLNEYNLLSRQSAGDSVGPMLLKRPPPEGDG